MGASCIIYKLRGEPKPLDAVDGVLVKDKREQRSVEKYLRELYEFQFEEDYQDFLDGFIVRDKGKSDKDESTNKDKG